MSLTAGQVDNPKPIRNYERMTIARLRESTATESHSPQRCESPPLRLLLVAPYFPPNATVGAKRFAFLTDKFQAFGYDIDTLTLRLRRSDSLDSSLPRPGRVHPVASILPHAVDRSDLFSRTYNRFVSTVIGIPDQHIGWLPLSVVTGRRVASEGVPDIIIATGPPFTAFIAGAILRNITGAKLILDYRDPWSSFNWEDTATGRRMTRPLSRRLERYAVRSASALVFATEIMRECFETMYRGTRPEVSKVLTNGFNEPSGLETATLTPDAVNIVYAGSFYGERRLSILIDGLKELNRRPSSEGVRYAIHVFGKIMPDDRNHIVASGLVHMVHEHAAVDHNAVLKFMKAADVLYLPSGRDVKYALPFKLFDYLSVRRPILAVTPPDSAVARFISTLDCGEVVEAGRPAIIADAVERILVRHQEYTFVGREKYSWANVASCYDQLIKELIAGTSCLNI